jgi:hypothetical protein
MTRTVARQHLGLGLLLACVAVLWFALGNTTKFLVADALGQKIEMLVCTGMGVKKVSVPVQAADEDATTTIKHCSNAPLCQLAISPPLVSGLVFEPPHTVARWAWEPLPEGLRSLVKDNRPPPGRAPPLA